MPPHWFHILLSLADQKLHGLAITKDVLDRTSGAMNLWPAMLYGALKRMTEAGLVEEVDAPADFSGTGGKPRFYAITTAGRRACAQEASRLAAFVEVARGKKLIKPARAGRVR
jgi:DNA-binding PadR family transcriptional regulator